LNNVADNKRAERKHFSVRAVTTPVSNNGPVFINLETPELAVHKCSGCDSRNVVSSNYSISPKICAKQGVAGPANATNKISVVTDEWEYEGLTSYQQNRMDNWNDGTTDSEDSRLRYGLSSKL
jgi:hypothetical protein